MLDLKSCLILIYRKTRYILFHSCLAALITALLVNNSTGNNLEPGNLFKDCTVCPEMIVIPSGSFNMGSSQGKKGRARKIHDGEIAISDRLRAAPRALARLGRARTAALRAAPIPPPCPASTSRRRSRSSRSSGSRQRTPRGSRPRRGVLCASRTPPSPSCCQPSATCRCASRLAA